MANATGWKEIDKLIADTHRLIKESNELFEAVERSNRFHPKKPPKRSGRIYKRAFGF